MLSMPPAIHVVVPGDTLYGITQEVYGDGDDWPQIWHDNPSIGNPNLIFPGERIRLPKHLGKDSDSTTVYSGRHSRTRVARASNTARYNLSGTLSCSGLESLWIANGGSPNSAFIAAEIAKAESGGNQYATGPVGEKGYWQINPAAWGNLATYDPNGNARAAIYISHNGADWTPWTTYTSGRYSGEC